MKGKFKITRLLNKFLVVLIVLSASGSLMAQSVEIKLNIPVQNPFEGEILFTDKEQETAEKDFLSLEPSQPALVYKAEINPEKTIFEPVKFENNLRLKEREVLKHIGEGDNPSEIEKKDKFHWKPALIQSGIFLGIQHGFRLRQEKTYTRLGGPFFKNWGQSIKGLRGWNDGDSVFINYVAHPLQGGFTGRIFINNSDKAKRQEFGKSKEYWQSRLKTLAWSAFWSTQFEIGPISEASIGNVGTFEKNGYSTMSWGDLIITPVAGTGVVIGEDVIDKYILKNWLERKTGNRVTTKIKIWRSILTPVLSLSNLIRLKPPWKRDNR